MNSSQAPAKFPVAWASSAGSSFVRTIPKAASSTPGAASLDTGFPPPCFQALSAGGVAPFGEDFNGILNWITSWILWQQSGGMPGYDAGQSTAIGGYFAGATLISADGTHFWRSLVDNNTSDPDTGGANWEVLTPGSYPWASITGAPSFVLASAFTGSNQLLGNSGYQKLPGGLILQWTRYVPPGGGGYITVTLPTTFPNACVGAWGTTGDASTVLAVAPAGLTASSVQVQNGGGATGFLFALGF